MAGCCPEMPTIEGSVEFPIPSGPVRCVCCGEPLELRCAKRCGQAAASVAAAAAAHPSIGYVASTTPAPRRALDLALAATDTRSYRPRTYKPKGCACGQAFTPTGPRDVRCPTCKGHSRARTQSTLEFDA